MWGILPILKLDLNVKKILWLHVEHNINFLKKIVNGNFELFAVSKYLADRIKYLTPKSINILPNSIIYNDFNIEWQPQKIIFCNSRISAEKRVKDAVLAFINFSRKNNDFEINLCKGGYPFGSNDKYLNEIYEILKKYPNVNVKFYDNLNWNDIPLILSKCSVVILPTSNESFGLSALETMACGVPLVTTNAGNLPLLTKGCSIVADIGNINQFIDGLNRSVTPIRGNYLSKEIAKTYDYQIIAKKFINNL